MDIILISSPEIVSGLFYIIRLSQPLDISVIDTPVVLKKRSVGYAER